METAHQPQETEMNTFKRALAATVAAIGFVQTISVPMAACLALVSAKPSAVSRIRLGGAQRRECQTLI